ncbi:MAG: hypothetical protein NTW86_19335 [Candidatus Sumerlaeota bacterium]|nr:hypothetical protein [Candidatus Sumerlaeota bacterium]
MNEIDEIMEEIRRGPWRMSEQCGHDVRRYIESLKQLNTRYADQVEKCRKLQTAAAPTPSAHE